MNNNEENDCIGCKLYNDFGEQVCSAAFKTKIAGIVCPCMKCLIKVMCDDVCDDFKMHRALLFVKDYHGRYMNGRKRSFIRNIIK